MIMCPELIARISLCVQKIGLSVVTVSKVVDRLRMDFDEKVPSVTTVRTILLQRFGLSYRRFDSSSILYDLRRLDTKRQWLARVISHLLLEDFLFVCMDESSFKMGWRPSKQWQIKKSVQRQCEVERASRLR